jgi:hypothetical protein
MRWAVWMSLKAFETVGVGGLPYMTLKLNLRSPDSRFSRFPQLSPVTGEQNTHL